MPKLNFLELLRRTAIVVGVVFLSIVTLGWLPIGEVGLTEDDYRHQMYKEKPRPSRG